jgi:hypothetical protein
MFEKFPKIYNVYFLAIVATMGGMLFGFDISSMSAIIGTNQYMQVHRRQSVFRSPNTDDS